ncbi:hypothetical protein C3L50_04095 [Flavobacterium alvei]|uniref:DUF3788 domain-containing protein n=1 Tax=Flavobacterium alvei TaxID=2080416 RepID=A0A2S5ADR2_9FLAO|nr:hypothetical protein C3L50_04095 [Flavobacterium alvei]
MEIRLLSEENVYPTNEVLEIILGESYVVFNEFIEIITNKNIGLGVEWRYYKDGKSWLCKVSLKKKTFFWLSVWDGYFKIGFYFAEKNSSEIENLDIANTIKEDFKVSKKIGKLIPLAISMNRKEQITDVLKIIEYKKNLK